ncbi:uncharacterized protein LOC109707236 [Ananas comosus]|uniref:Uncharacterized protein LOC109707236 n=1 Tax=Ananas comosus TaxID=4615 RepID=A0A6P5EKL4_ANACO|nr:uncharacterized protein LOC109707236 [Ananas comosus]
MFQVHCKPIQIQLHIRTCIIKNLFSCGNNCDSTVGDIKLKMEEVLVQSQVAAGNKAREVVLNIKALMRTSEKCSGREKMKKTLSRKGSCRTERVFSDEPDSEACSQMDQLRQPLVPAKAHVAAPTSVSIPTITDIGDRRNIRRLNFLTAIHPKKILISLRLCLAWVQ